MFNDIKRNKIESMLIVFLFIVAITLIIYYICISLDLGTISIVIAFVFSITSAWSSYYYSDKIILNLNNARPASKEENLQLVNILDSLVVAAGLPKKPDLYIIDDDQNETGIVYLDKEAANQQDYYGIYGFNFEHYRFEFCYSQKCYERF